MVYETHEYYFNSKKDKLMKQMAVCRKYNRDFAVCLKNTVNSLVA
jgi:hypothetical protein